MWWAADQPLSVETPAKVLHLSVVHLEPRNSVKARLISRWISYSNASTEFPLSCIFLANKPTLFPCLNSVTAGEGLMHSLFTPRAGSVFGLVSVRINAAAQQQNMSNAEHQEGANAQ